MSAPASIDSQSTIPSYALYGEEVEFPDILHCEIMADRAAGHDWAIDAHRHRNLHQIFLFSDSNAVFRLGDQQVATDRLCLLNVPAGVVHAFRFSPGVAGHVLTVATAELPQVYDGGAEKLPFLDQPFHVSPPEALRDLFTMVHQEYLGRGAARAGMLRALALQIACHAARLAESELGMSHNMAADARMEDFDRLIQRHFNGGWRVKDYAAAMNISRNHLNRICRQSRGQSALDVIDTAVMQKACRLLAYTRLGVAEIGFQMGFDDPSYFSRAFRRRTGLSPRDYRRRLAR